jgi:hypothetical protein
VRRRAFVVGGIGGAALIACRPWTRTTPRPDEPTEHELATLAAIAETFLPGARGAPGAADTGALAAIIDPAYGLGPYLAQVVADLDDWVALTHGLATFADLDPGARELALEQRMGLHGGLITSWYLPVYDAILALTKVAFYGGRTSPLGTSYSGFPGPSRGYAPGSAAGAYTSGDLPRALATGTASTIHVIGAGTVTSVQASALATCDAAAARLRAVLRITAPDGRRSELPLRVAVLDDVALPLAGGPAAGAWRLEVVAGAGPAAVLQLWSLRLRTDLDDAR